MMRALVCHNSGHSNSRSRERALSFHIYPLPHKLHTIHNSNTCPGYLQPLTCVLMASGCYFGWGLLLAQQQQKSDQFWFSVGDKEDDLCHELLVDTSCCGLAMALRAMEEE